MDRMHSTPTDAPALSSASTAPPTAPSATSTPGIMGSLRRSMSSLSLRSIISTTSAAASTLSRGAASVAAAATSSASAATATVEEYPEDVDFADDDPCASCADPCAEHPQMSARLQAKVSTSSMLGSVKPYSHHLVVCSGNTAHSWAARVETESALARAVGKAADAMQTSTVVRPGVNRVLATVCDRASSAGSPGHYWDDAGNEIECADVMVFPDRVVLTHVTAANAEAVITSYFAHGEVRPDAFPDATCTAGAPAVAPLDIEQCVLVCAHKKRDSRCGEAAPLLIRAFQEEVDAYESSATLTPHSVGIYGTTHIGGHKFAGTLIVYREREGHWYGRVRTCDVPILVREQLVDGKPVKKFWRGRMSPAS
ncbi:hypothetical protein H9P43_009037 [Blastocladiella emersonii ATCC 22665]|nr:hypothetical protein H9P43_009016 [Blastocladiella emersonii ATCC 22665]KAI9155927.1 hypothetical protein H9P43_009037 [Blastocladiella emersonii ATCC 22665]